MNHKLSLSLLFLLALTACTSLYRGTITLTNVVDAAAKEYAILYNQGVVSPEVDLKVEAAHLKYREAAKVASDALRVYKETGDQGAYTRALEAVRLAATIFVDRIVPLLIESKGTKLRNDLSKATEL